MHIINANEIGVYCGAASHAGLSLLFVAYIQLASSSSYISLFLLSNYNCISENSAERDVYIFRKLVIAYPDYSYNVLYFIIMRIM